MLYLVLYLGPLTPILITIYLIKFAGLIEVHPDFRQLALSLRKLQGIIRHGLQDNCQGTTYPGMTCLRNTVQWQSPSRSRLVSSPPRASNVLFGLIFEQSNHTRLYEVCSWDMTTLVFLAFLAGTRSHYDLNTQNVLTLVISASTLPTLSDAYSGC